MTENCKHCGQPFPQKFDHGRLKVYCSRDCYLKGNAKPIDNCEVCGKPFPRKVNGGQRQRCCSKVCAHKTRIETRTCKTCGKVYQRSNWTKAHPDYCSAQCTPREPCPCCGTIIVGRRINKSTNAQRFCSRRCTLYYHTVLKTTDNYGARGFVGTMRRLGALVCERCGESSLYALEVHHKDRDRTNNSVDNLETVCHVCHGHEHDKDHQTTEAQFEGERKKRNRDKRIADFIVANGIEIP